MVRNNNHTAYNTKGDIIHSKVPIHPGEILREEIETRGIKKKYFARELDIAPSNLSELFAGKRNINAEMALKIEQAIGISAEFWLRVQNRHDLTIVRNKHEENSAA